jgi:hypothetical protein
MIKKKPIKGYYLLLQKPKGAKTWKPCPLHNPFLHKYKNMARKEINGNEEYQKLVEVEIKILK